MDVIKKRACESKIWNKTLHRNLWVRCHGAQFKTTWNYLIIPKVWSYFFTINVQILNYQNLPLCLVRIFLRGIHFSIVCSFFFNIKLTSLSFSCSTAHCLISYSLPTDQVQVATRNRFDRSEWFTTIYQPELAVYAASLCLPPCSLAGLRSPRLTFLGVLLILVRMVVHLDHLYT